MVHTFATRLLAGQQIVVHDGGRYSSDLVYVDDVAHAILAAMQPHVTGCFNIGAGRRVSTAEVARCLGSLVDGAGSLIQIAPSGTGPAGGFAELDVARAREHLAHRATSLAEGLSAYVKWLRL